MQLFKNTTRKAILIGSPGTGRNFLQGVKHDMVTMNKFLRSNKGGSWEATEIVELQNPHATEVMHHIKSTLADYVFVYFSGHGWTSLGGSRMLALKDQPICDLSLLSNSPRQLVIVDACRNYTSSGLDGVPNFDEHVDHFEEITTYDLFSEAIAASPEGKVIVHATQPGKYSYDSLSGGCFTQALLGVSTRMRADNLYTPCTIESILRHVPVVLRKNQNLQTPEITYNKGNLTVPFALTSITGNHRRMIQKDNSNALVATLILFGAVGLVVAATN